MDHQDPFARPRLGISQDLRFFLDSHRIRASLVGRFQLMVSCCIVFFYCFLSDKVFENISNLQKTLNEQYQGFLKNETSNTSHVIWNFFEFETPIDLVVFKAKVTIGLQTITALFHVVSSIFVLCACRESFPLSRAITFCKWTINMNMAFHMSDILIFIASIHTTQVAFALIMFRYLFHYEVSGLSKMLESLSPPPPRHQ